MVGVDAAKSTYSNNITPSITPSTSLVFPTEEPNSPHTGAQASSGGFDVGKAVDLSKFQVADDAEPKSVCNSEHFNEPTTDWRSIYTATFLSFCGSVQFSLYFSSLWPFLQQVDATSSEAFFGYIVACYSLGMIIGSPLMGYCSNRMHRVRPLLLGGLALMLAGNLIYVSVQFWPSRWTMWLWGVERKVEVSRKFLLLFGRFVTGLGSSNISLLKAYASTASVAKDRSRAIAFVTGGQALGMMMGPAFQAVFTPIGYPGLLLYLLPSANTTAEQGRRGFWLSMYTAPAYMACVMNAICTGTLLTIFCESYAGLAEVSLCLGEGKGMAASNASASSSTRESKGLSPANYYHRLPRYDRLATLVCYATRFSQMFVTTCLETIGAPLAAASYPWPRSKVVLYTSVGQGLSGAVSFLVYMCYIVLRLDRVANFGRCCVLSLGCLILFHVLTYPGYSLWPVTELIGSVPTTSDNSSSSIGGNGEHIGCDEDKYAWCRAVHPPPPWFFYASYVICIGFAFPNISVALNTLFSRIIGPRRQGTEQGVLQMSGALARMLAPIITSTLFVGSGPSLVWIVDIAPIAATLLLWFLLHARMVPLEERWKRIKERENNVNPPLRMRPEVRFQKRNGEKKWCFTTNSEAELMLRKRSEDVSARSLASGANHEESGLNR